MKQYIQFTIKTIPFIPDIVSGFLWELNISGINEGADSLKIFTNEVTEVSEEEISNILQKLVEDNIISSFEIEAHTYEYKNWNEEWEKGVNVIEVSNLITIKPSFKDYENKQNKIVITIDPKMSFGTGEHESTKLVIQLMEKYIKKEIRVLDVGTGTGILSIAAIKLGARSVLAIDNDEWCFTNAEENSQLNGTADKIDIRLSEINQIEEKDFDLILANIQKNILLDIYDQAKDKLKKNGLVILSGLLIGDEKDIVEGYIEFNLLEQKSMGEWLALVFQKI